MIIEHKKGKPAVLVLMATYNGARFVGEQIDSILRQEDVDVHICICDDGSVDETCDICHSYSDAYENVDFHRNDCNKGVTKNFLDMTASADAERYDYFAFSDQDDVWQPRKLSRAVETLGRFEEDSPLLYYSDVTNVDTGLVNPRSGYSAYAPYADNLDLLLVWNWAPGCTMVFNAALLELIASHSTLQNPRGHDAWVHLIAMTCGRVVPDLRQSYILRRITGDNVVGEDVKLHALPGRLRSIFAVLFSEPRKTHGASIAASELLEAFAPNMHADKRETVEKFAAYRESFSNRMKAAVTSDIRFPFARETTLARFKLLAGWY